MAKLQDIDLLKVGHTIQLAGAVYAGEGKVFLAMFPDEHGAVHAYDDDVVFVEEGAGDDAEYPEVVTLDMNREDWTTFLRQTDLLETEVLTAAGDDKGIVKAILRKSARQIEQGISWAVFRRDGYQCRYCGADDVPLTVDHVVLWEEGGPSTIENLVSACRKDNKIRGNTPYPEWLRHPHYKKVSRGLPADVRQQNEDLVATLDAIPRRLHQKSR